MRQDDDMSLKAAAAAAYPALLLAHVVHHPGNAMLVPITGPTAIFRLQKHGLGPDSHRPDWPFRHKSRLAFMA